VCRPETIEENHRVFISETLRHANPNLSKRVSAAAEEIKAIAMEIAQSSQKDVQWMDTSHTNLKGD
jgi:hypothetical protein